MEIKFIRIYLSGAKRIKELFDENERKDSKIEEMRRAVCAQDRQLKGYGKDFEAMLRQIEEHKVEAVLLQKQIALLKKMYLESEKARKDLTEKLSAAQELLDAAEERERERYETPSVACGDTSLKEGGKEGGEGA